MRGFLYTVSLGFSAINSTQAEVTFNMPVKEVKPANFVVTDKDGNLVFVSKVELNAVKDVATLTFFSQFVDEATYSVEVSSVADADGNVMESATEAFTYLAAKVASIAFTSTTVAPDTDLRTVIEVKDELGRVVTDEQNIEFESSQPTIVGTDGKATSTPGSAIVVAKVGDVKTAPTTIKVATKAAATFTGYYVYKAAAATDTDAFVKLDADQKIDYVYANDDGSKLALYYKDQYGGNIDAVTDGLTVENMTPSVVIVQADGTIKAMSPGDGYVKVTNENVVTTVKIVVRATSDIAAMEVEETDVSVVTGQKATVKVTFKDQFGAKIDRTPAVKSAATATATAVAGANSVVITGVAEGSTTVDVSCKIGDETVKQIINVTVVKAADLATYEAVADVTKIDVSGDGKETALPKEANVVVNEIDANGNKIGTATAILAEVDKDGKAVESGKELVTISSQKVTAKNPGTAYVQVTVGSLVIDTLEFEVVKTKAYAKSVEFDRNDIVVENFTAENKSKIDDLLGEIVKIKDQYGDDYTLDSSEKVNYEYEVTNIKGIKFDSDNKEIKGVTSFESNGVADIVLTEVKVGAGENLLKANQVIKLSVKPVVKDGTFTLATSYGTETITSDTHFKDNDSNAVTITKDAFAKGNEIPEAHAQVEEEKALKLELKYNNSAVDLDDSTPYTYFSYDEGKTWEAHDNNADSVFWMGQRYLDKASVTIAGYHTDTSGGVWVTATIKIVDSFED